MADIPNGIDSGAARTPEARRAENSPTREQAISAFNFSWSRFDSAPLTDKWQIDSRDTMRKALAPKKRGNIDYDKGKFSHQKKSPSVYGVGIPLDEYMPIDDMLDWMYNQINSGKLTKEDFDGFTNAYDIISDFSFSIEAKETDRDRATRSARLNEIYEHIKKTKILRTKEGGTQMSDDEIQVEAERIVMKRRVFRPDKANPAPTPESDTPAASLVPGTEHEQAPGEAVVDASSIEDLAGESEEISDESMQHLRSVADAIDHPDNIVFESDGNTTGTSASSPLHTELSYPLDSSNSNEIYSRIAVSAWIYREVGPAPIIDYEAWHNEVDPNADADTREDHIQSKLETHKLNLQTWQRKVRDFTMHIPYGKESYGNLVSDLKNGLDPLDRYKNQQPPPYEVNKEFWISKFNKMGQSRDQALEKLQSVGLFLEPDEQRGSTPLGSGEPGFESIEPKPTTPVEAPTPEQVATEKPHVSSLYPGMKLTKDGEVYYVKDRRDKTSDYGSAVMNDMGPEWEVTLVRFDDGKEVLSSAYSEYELLNLLNNPDSRWAGDDIAGESFIHVESGKTYRIVPTYDKNGPKVRFYGENPLKADYAEDRAIFEKAIESGAFKKADTEASPGTVPAPVVETSAAGEPATPEPAETAEEPIKITDFHLGMNFIDISSGDMVYVSNIHEKSYVPELADLTENEVTLTNLRTGETQTIGREKLLEQIRKGEGFKPDPIEGRKYRDTKTGKILTAQTDFKDGRVRVNLVDETGKIVGTGKRQGFDEAVANGDYEEVKPAPPASTPTPVVSLRGTGPLPITPPIITSPPPPGVIPGAPSPAPVEAVPVDASPPPAEPAPSAPSEPTEPAPAPAPASPALPSAPEDEPSDASLAVDTLDSSQPLAQEPRPLNRRERLNASARGTLDRLDRAIERMRTTTAYPILPTDSALVRTFKDVGRAVEGAVIKPTSILFLNSARLATKTVSKVIDPFAPKLAKPLPEYQPTAPTSLNPKRTFIIANQSSDLSSPQELQVSEFINQEMKKGFWNWPKKIGLNWLEALAKKRVADQIRAASIKSGNPYVVIAMDQSKLRLRDLFLTRNLLWRKRDLPQLKLDTESRRNTATTASESILKQLQTEVGAGQELVQAQGELRQMLLDKIIHPLIKEEITDPLKVQELLREFVINKKNDPQVQAIFGRNTDRYGRLAEYFATNLIELTSEMKREINAGGTSLAVLDNEIDLRFARIRGRDQTERNLSITDKLIERAEGNRITGFVANPAVVSIASALALRFALKPTSRGAGASIVPIAGGILAGSIWGAIEGGYKVKVDRTTRQSGRTFMKNGEALRPPILRSNRPLERARYKAALIIYNRQASIEKGFETTDYERVPASELKTKLRNLLDTGNKSDPRVREEVIDAIAEIRARLDFYDLNGIHKISYDSEDVTHQQNLDLVELRAEARTVLRNEGLSDDQIITAERDAYGRYNQKFIENTEQQDRAFAAFRLKEMAIRGGIGAGIGAAAASATVFAADFVEHVSGFNPLREFNRAVRNTFGGVSSEIASFVPRLRDAFSHGGTVNVTDHLQAVVNADSHGVRFVNPTGETILRGQILPDGKIAVPGNISGVRSELEQAFDIHQESAPSEPLIPSETELIRDKTLGRVIRIPEGTHWVPNSENPKTWNLVSDSDPQKVLVSEARVDKKGGLHFNESASPWAEGVETTKGEIIKVHGKEGLWNTASTDVDRREWYRYDTAGKYEKNELKLTTGKKGNAVILSMHGMGLGTEEGLKPNPIDVRELKTKGFFITLGGNYEKPIWIPVTADGTMDAKLRLDPDDYKHFITRDGKRIYLGDIAKMVINQEALGKLKDGNIATELYGRRDVFSIARNGKNGAIEAGILRKRDGQNVAQIFATILGSEEAPKTINRPPEILIRPFEITKPPVQPPILLIPRDIEAPPIPIVYAPRFPLGNMAQSSSEPRENIDETPEASTPLPTGTSNEQEKASWQREFDQAVSESDKRKWDEEFNKAVLESESGKPKSRNLIELLEPAFYDRIAGEIVIDEKNVRDPESFFPMINSESTTLAGRVSDRLYQFELVSRKIPEEEKSRERSLRIIEQNKASISDFDSYLSQQNSQRQLQGKPIFDLTNNTGEDRFYLTGSPYDFAFYFAKPRSHWKNPQEGYVRGYITLSPNEIETVQRHFVDLAIALYDEGIDFEAKATSSVGLAERMENMVFYISSSDVQNATNIMKNFLSEKGIGEGHVLAALPSQQQGLSWAIEPGPLEIALWQEITGSSERRISFNQFASAMITPAYMERLATAHETKGNTEAAETFRKEAERVRGLIQTYQANLPKPKAPVEDSPELTPTPVLPPQAHRPVESSVPEGFTAGPPVISAQTLYTGPAPRASGRLTPEWRARQREIDRENALARRTGRALNNAAANVSTALASGTRKTGEVTARAGKAAIITGAQVASATARGGTKTASGVALGIGQAAERIPQGVTDAVSPLTSVGYGGGVIPRVTPAAPSPTPEPIPTTGATVASPPTPATVPPPAPESVLPITAGVGTTVYSTNGSEYRIVDEETIAGVKLFNLQPVDGNPNIRSSVAEKDLLNPTQFSRFRLAKITPESESITTPTPTTAPTPSPAPAPEPTAPVEETAPIPEEEPTEIPLKIYSDEEGNAYELVEIDDHGARVKYPNGSIRYVPRLLFDLQSAGEFYNPNATLPIAQPPVSETPEPASESESQKASELPAETISAPGSVAEPVITTATKPTTFQRTIKTAIQGADKVQQKIGEFAEKPSHQTIRSVTAVPLAAGVRDFKEVSRLAGQVNPTSATNKAGVKLGTISGIAGRKIGEFFAKRSK